MKKIITSVNDIGFHKRLKEKYNVIGKDIQYKEGIIEMLENNLDVEIVFLSDFFYSKFEKKEIIEKIKKINPKIQIKYYSKKDKNKKANKKINNKINNKKNNNINKLIRNLEKSFYEIIKIKKTNKRENKKLIEKTKKIYVFYGEEGSGKTIISSIFAKILSKNKKILLIDYNENNEIHKIFSKNNKIKILKKKDVEKNINIKNEKTKYDYIFIDLGNKNNKKEKEKIIKNANKIIILLQPNIMYLERTSNLIKKILKDFKIEKNKINILINKKSKYSISEKIIKKIFSDFYIIGYISLNIKFEKLINSKIKKIDFLEDKNLSNEIKKSIKNLGNQ